MQAVKTKNTGPEMTVRRALFASGYRYILHRRELPGCPDIAFPGRRKAIFVHGCFWHGHGCAKGRASKSRIEYWGPKLAANRSRDERNLVELGALGWDVFTVWQCELTDMENLLARLGTFLDGHSNSINKISSAR